MSWVKYDKDSLINLDKVIDINVGKTHTTNGNFVWTINFYDIEEHRYPSRIYNSIEECMHDFEYLTICLESGKQYIDITNVL